MKKKQIIVGARGSRLAVAQTVSVIRLLARKAPGYKFIFRRITTLGDRVKKWSRSDTGIFVKELEDALIAREIDLAVHSVKDLPYRIPGTLSLAAITARVEPRDILVTRDKNPGLAGLKSKAVIGTTSLRRKAQILKFRPDLRVKDLRGNLDTRLAKLNSGLYDAIVVAAAGLKRLKLKSLKAKIIPENVMLPPAGQGALAIEIRAGDEEVKELVSKIDDRESRICVECERSFLRYTQAGCRMPVAAYAEIKAGSIHLEGMIISLGGEKTVRLSMSGKISEGEMLGRELAGRILNSGGKEILRGMKNEEA